MSKKKRLQMQWRPKKSRLDQYQVQSDLLAEFTQARSEKITKVQSLPASRRLSIYKRQRETFVQAFRQSTNRSLQEMIKEAIINTDLCILMFKELTEAVRRHNHSIEQDQANAKKYIKTAFKLSQQNLTILDEMSDEELKQPMLKMEYIDLQRDQEYIDSLRNVHTTFLRFREGLISIFERMLFDGVFQASASNLWLKVVINNASFMFDLLVPQVSTIKGAIETTLDNLKARNQDISSADNYLNFLDTYSFASFHSCIFAQIITEAIYNLESGSTEGYSWPSYDEFVAKVQSKKDVLIQVQVIDRKTN